MQILGWCCTNIKKSNESQCIWTRKFNPLRTLDWFSGNYYNSKKLLDCIQHVELARAINFLLAALMDSTWTSIHLSAKRRGHLPFHWHQLQAFDCFGRGEPKLAKMRRPSGLELASSHWIFYFSHCATDQISWGNVPQFVISKVCGLLFDLERKKFPRML